MIPYPADPDRRAGDVFIHVPESKARGPSFVAVALLILVVAGGGGYGFGVWRTAQRHAPAEPSADARVTAPPPAAEPTAPVGQASAEEFLQDGRPSASPTYPPMDTTVSPYLAADAGEGDAWSEQTLLPPISPPHFIEPPVPPAHVLSELLYGEELVAKTLVANYGWIVEPGEIIDLRVDQVWNDPARISHGVYVTFVAMAEGRGIRASGLLRYDADESKRSGYAVRDFMPSSVVRVGSW